MNKYFVSRQQYWSEEDSHIVEIASGGLDYANADMLVAKYGHLGEGREYTDPREAAKAAIEIQAAWKRDSGLDVAIGAGFTGGFSMPFDPQSPEEIEAWAEKAYEKLPKCAHCGELMGKDKYGDPSIGEYDCCSEYCAEMRYFSREDDDAEG